MSNIAAKVKKVYDGTKKCFQAVGRFFAKFNVVLDVINGAGRAVHRAANRVASVFKQKQTAAVTVAVA